MLRVLLIKTFVKPVWDRRWLWALYLAIIALSQLFLEKSPLLQNLLLLFALVVFVIPHTSADFLLPAWILNPPWAKRVTYWIPAIIVLLIFGTITWLIAMASINFTIALFSALIMWHWGSLDALTIYPQMALAWIIASIGRGMLVVAAPLYFRPLETQELLLSLTGASESPILSTLYWLSKYLLILAICLELIAVLTNKFIEGRGIPERAVGHLAETVVLIVMFNWANLLVGTTFYFLILHSARHMSRVSSYIPESRNQVLDSGGILRSLPDYFMRTNFLNFVCTCLLATWFCWKILTGSTFFEASIACLVPLLLVMIPHALVSLLADLNPRRL